MQKDNKIYCDECDSYVRDITVEDREDEKKFTGGGDYFTWYNCDNCKTYDEDSYGEDFD